MKEYDLHVPLYYNDGRLIEAKKFQDLQQALLNEFRGLTFFPQGPRYLSSRSRVSRIERRRGSSLSLEPLETLRALPSVGEEFQRRSPAEVQVFRFVDHSHASAAELFEDAVMRNDDASARTDYEPRT